MSVANRVEVADRVDWFVRRHPTVIIAHIVDYADRMDDVKSYRQTTLDAKIVTVSRPIGSSTDRSYGKLELGIDASHAYQSLNNQMVIAVVGWLFSGLVFGAATLTTVRRNLRTPTAEPEDETARTESSSDKSQRDLGFQIATLMQNEKRVRKERDDAISANKSKSELIANMSHDLRTPLSAILGYADNLAQNRVDPPEDTESQRQAITDEECVQRIRQNGEHLLRIINQILDISRLEAGELQLEKQACSLFGILDEVTDATRIQAESKSLVFQLRVDGALPSTVNTDATRLKQILFNLTGNAVKFTEYGRVTLRVYSLQETTEYDVDFKCGIAFEVIDTGMGIPDEQLDNMFHRFRRGESLSCSDGTGLGLPISRGLAEELGGAISATSDLGRGSRFTLLMPVDEECSGSTKTLEQHRAEQIAARRKPDQDFEERTSRPQPTADSSSPKILYVEDGPDNQRLVSHILAKTGFEVVIVNDGQEAIDELHRSRDENDEYGLVLMDMQMPRVDGYEATRRLRSDGFDLPIVALTAHAMTQDRAKCLAAGCTEYLSKPIKPTVLREKIYEILQPAVDS